MRIDTHQHFWKYSAKKYDWIDNRMDVIRRDFLPADLKPVLDKASVDGTIAVQARQSYEETDWLLKLAKKNEFINGVVGWVDLRSPDVESYLKRFASNSKLMGIRHVLQDEEDDLFMLRDDFLRGIALLEKYKLTYDILIYPRHLPVAVRLVDQFPKQAFVLDHLAKPFIRDGIMEPWKSELEKLASFENVCCKVSGMVTEADWTNWEPSHLKPYLDVVFESFGEDRIMFGSDWPVCLLAASYESVLNTLLTYLADKPETIVNKVMGLNGARFYGL